MRVLLLVVAICCVWSNLAATNALDPYDSVTFSSGSSECKQSEWSIRSCFYVMPVNTTRCCSGTPNDVYTCVPQNMNCSVSAGSDDSNGPMPPISSGCGRNAQCRAKTWTWSPGGVRGYFLASFGWPCNMFGSVVSIVSGGYDCMGNPPTVDSICVDGAWQSNSSNNGNNYSLRLVGSPLVITGGSSPVTLSHIDIVLSPQMQGVPAVTVIGSSGAKIPYCYAVDLVMPQPMTAGTQVVIAAESITILEKCLVCSDWTLQLDFNTSASYDPICTMSSTSKSLSVHYGLRDLTVYPPCSIIGGTWVYPYPIQPATTPDHAHLNFLVSFHKDGTFSGRAGYYFSTLDTTGPTQAFCGVSVTGSYAYTSLARKGSISVNSLKCAGDGCNEYSCTDVLSDIQSMGELELTFPEFPESCDRVTWQSDNSGGYYSYFDTFYSSYTSGGFFGYTNYLVRPPSQVELLTTLAKGDTRVLVNLTRCPTDNEVHAFTADFAKRLSLPYPSRFIEVADVVGCWLVRQSSTDDVHAAAIDIGAYGSQTSFELAATLVSSLNSASGELLQPLMRGSAYVYESDAPLSPSTPPKEPPSTSSGWSGGAVFMVALFTFLITAALAGGAFFYYLRRQQGPAYAPLSTLGDDNDA